jgi:hypothetical protein
MMTEAKYELSHAMNDAYMHAVNDIDDYFEYRCKSKEDQSVVHGILDQLHSKFQKLHLEYKDKV